MVDKSFETKSVGKKVAKSNDCILSEKPMSRLVFSPVIHGKGIKGRLIRQRRASEDDAWIPDKAINIRSLEKEQCVSLEMTTEAVGNFYAEINKLKDFLQQQGIPYGHHQYRVSRHDESFEKIWEEISGNPELAKKLAYAALHERKKKTINELEQRLTQGNYSETSGNDCWQKWIYDNNWLFGVQYNEPVQKCKIDLAGSMPDYIFPTLDGFADVLEIKLPTAQVLLKDNNHYDTWKWCKETNIAIGQVVNYLSCLDRNAAEIEKKLNRDNNFQIILIKPRAYILVGNSAGWGQEKKEALRRMNDSLHNIEIMTYQDLLDRGKKIVKLYDK